MASGLDEPSQALLHKTLPLASPPTPTREDGIDSSTHCPPIVFNYGPRRFRDLPFLLLFLIFVLCTFVLGVFCIAHRNPNYRNVRSYIFDKNTSSCVESLALLDETGSWSWFNAANMKPSPFLKDLISTLVITLVLSMLFLFGLLWLLKTYAKQVVYASIPLFVLIPLFMNVFWFVACTLGENCRQSFPLAFRIFVLVFIFGVIGVIMWMIVANWHRFELTAKILGISAHALENNLRLLGVLPCLMLALLVFFSPVISFLVFARFNGKIEPQLSSSGGKYSCVWKQDRWVPAYYALAILAMTWSTMVMIEAEVYIISGTIAQWYFAKDASMMRRAMRSSFRNAFGSSFGTVCFSGLLIWVVRVVRNIVDSAIQEDAAGINLAFQCCVKFLFSAVDFLNKFTIHFSAITGESYCSASKTTYELLRRNLLSVALVETVSTPILVGIIFVISTAYAIVVRATLTTVSKTRADSYLVAVLASLIFFMIMSFFVHVLDNVIDTIYICFAIDGDNGEVSKREVHQAYALLPVTFSATTSLV